MNERSEQLDQLATALCAAQAEFTAIPKDSQNPFFKSKYAGLAKVIETASPVVAKHGLSVSQMLGVDESGADTLTTWLLHSSGQFIAESMRLHLSKDDAQGHGSAVTYGKRYAYMAVLGLVADEDDDGNKASRPQGQNDGQQRSRPSAAPVKDSERIASAKQRGMLNARASEAELPPSDYANLILTAAGEELREFENQDHAQAWLNKSLDRLPARLVDPVLKQIERIKEAQGQLA